jgi:excisionase family DNA binding protein
MDTAGRAPTPVVVPPAAVPVLWVLMKRAGIPEQLRELEGQLSPRRRAAVAEALRQFPLIAQWQEESDAELTCRTSVDGSAEELLTEAAAGLVQEIDPEEAAVLLNVSTSRVRQLCRSGELVARRVGRSWRIDRVSVELRAMGQAA